VIHVYHREHDAQFFAESNEEAEECDRIRAAGNGDPYPIPGVDELVPANKMAEFLR
jgi:hypothetical protein